MISTTSGPRHGDMTGQPLLFDSDFRYTDRISKAEYVWRKYAPILRGATILDVGGDECYLKRHLDPHARYWGVGRGGSPDQEIDLEQGVLPFPDRSFQCVLCLDVLEHVEQIHAIFDQLCRVADRHVVIALPNPWATFWRMLRKRDHDAQRPLKFYGLPVDQPLDRHRWFFGADDARQFIAQRAERNSFRVLQMDFGRDDPRRWGWLTRLKRRLQTMGLRGDVDRVNLYGRSVWAVLERAEKPE